MPETKSSKIKRKALNNTNIVFINCHLGPKLPLSPQLLSITFPLAACAVPILGSSVFVQIFIFYHFSFDYNLELQQNSIGMVAMALEGCEGAS